MMRILVWLLFHGAVAGMALGALTHLFFEPECQANLFQFTEELVRGPRCFRSLLLLGCVKIFMMQHLQPDFASAALAEYSGEVGHPFRSKPKSGQIPAGIGGQIQSGISGQLDSGIDGQLGPEYA